MVASIIFIEILDSKNEQALIEFPSSFSCSTHFIKVKPVLYIEYRILVSQSNVSQLIGWEVFYCKTSGTLFILIESQELAA